MKPDLWKSINREVLSQGNNCDGFTLIEVIFVILITGFVTSSMIVFSTNAMSPNKSPVIQVKDLLKLSKDAEAALADYATDRATFDPTNYSTYSSDSVSTYQTVKDENDGVYTISDTGSTLTFKKVVLEPPNNNYQFILFFANI